MKSENCKLLRKKHKNLNIDLGNSQENVDYKLDKRSHDIYSKVENSNYINSTQSIEFGCDSVRFKNDNFSIGSKGIKQINTGKLISVVDPKDFEKGKQIGLGSSGSVYSSIYKPNGMTVAIKSINIYDKSKRKQFKNDLKVLFENNCPYLVNFYGAFFEEGSVKLVLEYMNLGSLDKIISKIKEQCYSANLSAACTPENVLGIITKDILEGLHFLHKKHQIHRDLKPGNILISSEGSVKLTDFGISKTLENSTQFCNSFVGTKNYMSPERILGSDYSYSSDIWSLGLIVYELATGHFPYKFSKYYIEHVDYILNQPDPTLPNEGGFSDDLQDFITRCLRKDPKERDSVFDLLKHPWIVGVSPDDDVIKLRSWLKYIYEKMDVDDK